MAEIKSVTIKLTDKQRSQIRNLTGENHTEVRFERTALESKVAPRLQAKSAPRLHAKTAPRLHAKTAPRLHAKTAPRLHAKTAPRKA